MVPCDVAPALGFGYPIIHRPFVIEYTAPVIAATGGSERIIFELARTRLPATEAVT